MNHLRDRLIEMGEVLKNMRKEVDGEVIISFEVKEEDPDTCEDWFRVNIENTFHKAYGTGLNLYDATYMARANLKRAEKEADEIKSQIVAVKVASSEVIVVEKPVKTISALNIKINKPKTPLLIKKKEE